MNVPAHFYLPGNTKLFSAWKLWFSGNPDYICTNTGREMITAPIHPLMNSTVGSIRQKLWNKFNTGWKKVSMMMYIAPGNECVGSFVRNEWVNITEANFQ